MAKIKKYQAGGKADTTLPKPIQRKWIATVGDTAAVKKKADSLKLSTDKVKDALKARIAAKKQRSGGKTPAKKAQTGKSVSAADSVLKYNRLAQKQIDTLMNPKTSSKTYKEVNQRLRGSTMPQEKKWMNVATGRSSASKKRYGGNVKKKK
jgi:hypothetical protein